jgi:sulfite reductase (NADPH) hemoprotein beta-component
MSRIRSTHDQNLVLSDVREDQLFELWQALTALDLATANIGTLTDLICCPGLDFCALANAGSIGVAKQITDRFNDLDYLYDLGEIRLKMSGCINACGHHHIGHIGILGINKAGEEYYQIMLGGSAADDASLGKWIGPAIAQSEVANALERMLTAFAAIREGEERFLDTYRRVGATPFKEAVYGA